MPVLNYAMGQLDPILYFEHHQTGEISLLPTTEDTLRFKDEMLRRGWILKEADTLPRIDDLQKRMQQQEYAKLQKELERDEAAFGTVRKRVRDRLYARMVSSSTPAYERDFIKNYLMLREEKREHWRKRFTADVCYLNLRENDNINRLRDAVNNVPEMKDETCKVCGKHRSIKGGDRCMICMGK